MCVVAVAMSLQLARTSCSCSIQPWTSSDLVAAQAHAKDTLRLQHPLHKLQGQGWYGDT